MCPRTDEKRERKLTVSQPELVLSFSLPCLDYHFLLNFHLHCHCILFPASLTLLPLFGSSMIPVLALHLLVSIDCFLFWLPTDWPWPDASWKGAHEYYVTRSDTTTTHTNTPMLCNSKLNQPLAYTQHIDIEDYCEICCSFPVMWLFPEWFCFEKDAGRGNMSSAFTRAPINRWGDLFIYLSDRCKAAESHQLWRKASLELFSSGLQVLLLLWAHFTCSVYHYIHLHTADFHFGKNSLTFVPKSCWPFWCH